MKKLYFFLIILFSGLTTNANKDWDYKNYFRTDSALVYSWDAGIKDWVLSSSQVYFCGANGKLDSIIEKSLESGINLSKTVNLYNNEGLIATEIYYTWNGVWIPTSRNQITYDEKGNYSEIVIQTWRADNWVNSALQKYTKYNLAGALIEFQMFEWVNNDWVYQWTDYWSYDEKGLLIKRLALLPDSIVYYQILYKYNEDGLRTEMYAQYASGSNWDNSWLQDYQYNDCGVQISLIRYAGVGTDWSPSTKTIFFNSFNYKGYPGKKIPVCHNRQTIYISKNALKAHLAHGDCIGECTVEKKPEKRGCDENEKPQKPPFTIYPNPAREKITIKFDNGICLESKKVELTDFYGKLIKSFNINDNSDLSISRNNIHSGKYYIRLVGKEVYSAVVIFE
ncbi:MAG: T9SS type A sorting domain-containing protein [Bacteroidales bacterium]